MITELITYSGFPHLLTRTDLNGEIIITLDHNKPIEVNDGFTFQYVMNSIKLDEENFKVINYLKVVEVIEKRLSKGNYKLNPTPDHYKVKCVMVNDHIDVNKIEYSNSYKLPE